MKHTLHVIYPMGEGTYFDFDYYRDVHLPLVREQVRPFTEMHIVSRQAEGGIMSPPGYYAVATLLFDTQDDLEAAMDASDAIIADLPEFTNSVPSLIIGEALVYAGMTD